jgi:hypothetical protein
MALPLGELFGKRAENALYGVGLVFELLEEEVEDFA